MPRNGSPYEVISGPVTAYIAPVGTAFPAIDELEVDFDTDWVKAGVLGPLNYTRDGVSIEDEASYEKFRADGDSGTRKIFLTEEGRMVTIQFADATAELRSIAYNNNTITEVTPAPGVAGEKSVGLSRNSVEPAQFAVLIRTPSPYMADGNAQYEFAVCSQTGVPKPVYKRGTPATIELKFEVLVDPNASDISEYLGVYRCQTAVAGT